MRTAYIKYLTALLISGTNGIIASHIALSSYEIVFLRTLIGSILLIFLFKITGGAFRFKKSQKDVVYIAISGVAMGASWMLLYEGYQQIGVSIATLLYYCGPVIVMILSPVIFKEKLTTVKTASFTVVLAGLVLVNYNVIHEDGNLWGVACGCMSAVMYFFMITFNKKSKNITGMENAAIQLAVSFLTVAVFMLIKQGLVIELTGVNWFAVTFEPVKLFL